MKTIQKTVHLWISSELVEAIGNKEGNGISFWNSLKVT